MGGGKKERENRSARENEPASSGSRFPRPYTHTYSIEWGTPTTHWCIYVYTRVLYAGAGDLLKTNCESVASRLRSHISRRKDFDSGIRSRGSYVVR